MCTFVWRIEALNITFVPCFFNFLCLLVTPSSQMKRSLSTVSISHIAHSTTVIWLSFFFSSRLGSLFLSNLSLQDMSFKLGITFLTALCIFSMFLLSFALWGIMRLLCTLTLGYQHYYVLLYHLVHMMKCSL